MISPPTSMSSMLPWRYVPVTQSKLWTKSRDRSQFIQAECAGVRLFEPHADLPRAKWRLDKGSQGYLPARLLPASA